MAPPADPQRSPGTGSHAATLPPSLKDIVNDNRDSAYYSEGSSKHTSAASFGHGHLASPSSSSYQTSIGDKTPSPTTSALAQQALSHTPASSMSLSAVVSHNGPNPTVITEHERYGSQVEAAPSSATLPPPSYGDPDMMSRRESVDSRSMNQNFNEMRLGNSPYATHNPSTTSLQNTLSNQRNPRAGSVLDSLAPHRMSNGYQPGVARNPDPATKVTRTAPAITGPAAGDVARAAEPTKGQAWAFPDDAARPTLNGPQQFFDSRRSSVADSLASSQFTEPYLPPGQRRLEEGPDPYSGNRLSSTSGEFPSVHHHGLQQRNFSSTHAEDARGAQQGTYSRTPESRQSHKLAERKRRTEMKELFEQLRVLMPHERGSKASKWEILTKAIQEHQRLKGLIDAHNNERDHLMSKFDSMAKEIDYLRNENARLRLQPPNSTTAFHTGPAGGPPPMANSQSGPHMANAHPPPPVPNSHTAPPMTSSHPAQYPTGDTYANPVKMESLPSLRRLTDSIEAGPDTMTGVEYDDPRHLRFRSG